MKVEGINKVCVLGAGTMGLQISLVSARAGYEVIVFDASEDTLKQAPLRHNQIAQWIEQSGRFKFPNLEDILSRISYISNPAGAVQNVDLLSESVPEQLELKRKIHRQFESLCPPRVIITTNTSSLLVSDIDIALRRPEQFAAMHFHKHNTNRTAQRRSVFCLRSFRVHHRANYLSRCRSIGHSTNVMPYFKAAGEWGVGGII